MCGARYKPPSLPPPPASLQQDAAPIRAALEQGLVVRAVSLAERLRSSHRDFFKQLTQAFGDLTDVVYELAKERLPVIITDLGERFSDAFRAALVAVHGEETVDSELAWYREASREKQSDGRYGPPTQTDGQLLVVRWGEILQVVEKIVRAERIFSPDRIEQLYGFRDLLQSGPDDPDWRRLIGEVDEIREGLEAIASHPGNAASLLQSLYVYQKQVARKDVDSIREDWMVRGLVLCAPHSIDAAITDPRLRESLDRDWDRDAPLATVPPSLMEEGSSVGAQVITALLDRLVDTPSAAEKPSDKPVGRAGGPAASMDNEAKALALLAMHEDWTVTDIAKSLGVNRTTPYDWPRFKAALAVRKASRRDRLPRGRKDGKGNLDAWRDELE